MASAGQNLLPATRREDPLHSIALSFLHIGKESRLADCSGTFDELDAAVLLA